MRITEVQISGFRSLNFAQTNVGDYTCAIGKNNTGKSAFLRALRLLFDPTVRSDPNDQCKLTDARPCLVQATVEGLADTVDGACDGSLTFRYRPGPPSAIYEVATDIAEDALLLGASRGKLRRGEVGELPAGTPYKPLLVKALAGSHGRITKDQAVEAYALVDAAGLVKKTRGWRAAARHPLADHCKVIYLPADLKAEDAMGGSGTAQYGQVFGLLIKKATQSNEGLRNATQALAKAVEAVIGQAEDGTWNLSELNKLQQVLQEEISGFDPSIRLEPGLTAPTAVEPTFGVTFDLTDGIVSGLPSFGHGLRRSVVFSMLRSLRRINEISGTGLAESGEHYLFLIEEPELYLHPQAERQRMQELLELANLDNVQVVACTHSAFFVDLNFFESIIRFDRVPGAETQLSSWKDLDLAETERKRLTTTYYFDPTRSAMLFADRVILVEGQSEKVTVPAVASRLGLPVNKVEVVDCGGNANIPIYQRVLEGFSIPYTAWFDSKETAEVARGKAAAKKFGVIVQTRTNWEVMTGIGKGTEGDKCFRSWKKFVDEGEDPNELTLTCIRSAYNGESFDASAQAKAKKKAQDKYAKPAADKEALGLSDEDY